MGWSGRSPAPPAREAGIAVLRTSAPRGVREPAPRDLSGPLALVRPRRRSRHADRRSSYRLRVAGAGSGDPQRAVLVCPLPIFLRLASATTSRTSPRSPTSWASSSARRSLDKHAITHEEYKHWRKLNPLVFTTQYSRESSPSLSAKPKIPPA
jgi:hypothetical protein